ncbi:uncharacterized protein LOC130408324 isoform X2 [Triplophysa dalaica]|uniref:uncharacterized protein LOC130408324 isoform X2 n=1 Tax=Triplophysa dalaica TaxID=1582913 RepID=UPI0024DF3C13|nr:uncharacterized protein LOC130408324 isoform X2 [Triplophysa dalaica]
MRLPASLRFTFLVLLRLGFVLKTQPHPLLSPQTTPSPTLPAKLEEEEAQLSVVVVYRPSGPLHDFIEELDVLLSSFPEDSGPLVVLGDFNIHLEKPYAADFHTLTASFDLTRLVTASTHRSDRLVPLPAAPGCLTSSVNNVVHSGLLKGNGARPRTLLT